MGKIKDLFIAHPDCSEEIVIFQHICGMPVEGSYRSLRSLQCMRESSEELLRLVRKYQGKQGLLERLTNNKLNEILAAVQEIATKQLHTLYGM